jgi:ribosomal protein L31E
MAVKITETQKKHNTQQKCLDLLVKLRRCKTVICDFFDKKAKRVVSPLVNQHIYKRCNQQSIRQKIKEVAYG